MTEFSISWCDKCTTNVTSTVSGPGFLEGIRNGKWKKEITKIRKLFAAGDVDGANEAKKNLLGGVCPSGIFSKRSKECLTQHSGYFCGDLDDLEDVAAKRAKLEGLPWVFCVFLSPKGNGLKVFVKVPPSDAQKHENSFRAVEKLIFIATGIKIDPKCKDVNRFCFVSYDPDLYLNEDSVQVEPLPEQPRAKPNPTTFNLSLHQAAAVAVLGPVSWDEEGDRAPIPCPGKHLHTTGYTARECMVYLDYNPRPNVSCQHQHCASLLQGISHAINRKIKELEREGAASRSTTNKLSPLSEVNMIPIKFIDKPLFQADAFHMIVGKKNAGKGTFLSHLAARFTRGELGDKKNVIWIAAGEDSLAIDVRPRLEAAGADVTKVYYPQQIPQLPAEAGLLQKMAEDLGDVGLIVLDPISGMVPSKMDSHRDSEVRPVISPLNDIADQLKCVVVGVRHLKKDASGGALSAVLGSVDWGNVPRAVIAIVYDKGDDIRYAQVVAGNRVPNDSTSRGFRIVGADIVPGGEPVAKAIFIDGPGKDVDDLLGEDKPKESTTNTKKAAVRILDMLESANGEDLKQDDVFEQVAEELSMSVATVKRKAYFGTGMLHDLGLVKSYKELGKLKGGWFVKRSDLPRPPQFF